MIYSASITTIQNNKHLGWIGLRKIGTPMAQNLAKAGFPLTVYNRSAGKAAPLRQAGVSVSPDVAILMQNSDIIFTMIANDAAVQEVYDAVLAVKLSSYNRKGAANAAPSLLV